MAERVQQELVGNHGVDIVAGPDSFLCKITKKRGFRLTFYTHCYRGGRFGVLLGEIQLRSPPGTPGIRRSSSSELTGRIGSSEVTLCPIAIGVGALVFFSEKFSSKKKGAKKPKAAVQRPVQDRGVAAAPADCGAVVDYLCRFLSGHLIECHCFNTMV